MTGYPVLKLIVKYDDLREAKRLVAFNLTKELAGESAKENCYPWSNTAYHMCYKNAETYRWLSIQNVPVSWRSGRILNGTLSISKYGEVGSVTYPVPDKIHIPMIYVL